jgi:hypothetical protein
VFVFVFVLLIFVFTFVFELLLKWIWSSRSTSTNVKTQIFNCVYQFCNLFICSFLMLFFHVVCTCFCFVFGCCICFQRFVHWTTRNNQRETCTEYTYAGWLETNYGILSYYESFCSVKVAKVQNSFLAPEKKNYHQQNHIATLHTEKKKKKKNKKHHTYRLWKQTITTRKMNKKLIFFSTFQPKRNKFVQFDLVVASTQWDMESQYT